MSTFIASLFEQFCPLSESLNGTQWLYEHHKITKYWCILEDVLICRVFSFECVCTFPKCLRQVCLLVFHASYDTKSPLFIGWKKTSSWRCKLIQRNKKLEATFVWWNRIGNFFCKQFNQTHWSIQIRQHGGWWNSFVFCELLLCVSISK